MGTQLSFKEYRDKVKACFLGKNIGGTLGAPFECIRGVYDIDYYTHDLSLGVLPNDDLDLQLVWLNAAKTDLHSFPTRRSSDLQSLLHRGGLVGVRRWEEQSALRPGAPHLRLVQEPQQG